MPVNTQDRISSSKKPQVNNISDFLFNLLFLSCSLDAGTKYRYITMMQIDAGRFPVNELSELVWMVLAHLEHLALSLNVSR